MNPPNPHRLLPITLLLLLTSTLALPSNIPYISESRDPRFGASKALKTKTPNLANFPNYANLKTHTKHLIDIHLNWDMATYRKQSIDRLFADFVKKHGRNYLNGREEAFRKKMFEKNVKEAGLHNLRFAQGKSKFHLGITKFADRSDEEFMRRYASNTIPSSSSEGKASSLLNNNNENEYSNENNKNNNNEYNKNNNNEYNMKNTQNNNNEDHQQYTPKNQQNLKLTTEYPDEIDFRAKNVIGPLEDQGDCGACYSFSSVAATEAAYILKYKSSKNYRKLSKQQMVDCGPSFSEYLRGCNGGVLEAAYSYLHQKGISEAEDYPYIGVKGKCKEGSVRQFLKIRGYNILREINKDGILTMLAKQPVSMAIQVVPYMKLYSGGIIDIKGPCGFFYNHAIMAVGYSLDTEFPYFILKNTFGDEWGQDGYMYYQIGVGSYGMCAAINDNTSAPVI